jgi:hypothetical protein
MDLVRTEGGINKTSLDCAQRQVLLMMMMIIRPNYVTHLVLTVDNPSIIQYKI